MKKIATLPTFLFLITVFILSSCSSTFVTKRRYNKGYYVAHRATAPAVKKHMAPVAEQQEALVIKTLPEDRKTEQAVETLSPGSKKENANSSASPEIKEKTLAASSGTLKSKQPALFSAKKHFKTVSPAVTASKLYAGDREGLSLFWIIILIVLILWALGLIADIGPLVNILLVIALILLILWLLRVL